MFYFIAQRLPFQTNKRCNQLLENLVPMVSNIPPTASKFSHQLSIVKIVNVNFHESLCKAYENGYGINFV